MGNNCLRNIMGLMIGETSGKIMGKIHKFVPHKISLFGQVGGGLQPPQPPPPVKPGLSDLLDSVTTRFFLISSRNLAFDPISNLT